MPAFNSVQPNKILHLFTTIIFLISSGAHAQPNPSEPERRAFLSQSESLAYELGKTYQMSKNCDREFTKISPAKARGLFIRYMEEHEVEKTMESYQSGVASKSQANCQRWKLKASAPGLDALIVRYFKSALPFIRNTPNDK
jgi:hypothetical protein